MTDGASLELRSLQQQVHDQLLGRIIRGELAPGRRISPAAIATSLGVSITPVRDAVNLLAAEGLVEVLPRKGTVVAHTSRDDIVDLYGIRLLLEPGAAELAANLAGDAEIAEIRSLAELLEASPPEHRTITDVDQYMAEITLDQDLHSRVVRAAGNRRLASLYDGLRSHVLLLRFTFPVLTRTGGRRHGEHLRIAEAIAARDGARARVAMETHLRNAMADALARVEDTAADERTGT